MLFALLAFMLITITAGAQENNRRMEFSIAGSAQAFVGERETEHYLSFPIRIGRFVNENVLIEVEGIITGWDEAAYGDTEFGYIVSLNGSYNFIAGEKTMPFLLLGIGFSNGLPFANSVAYSNEDGPKPIVLNAGTGMKFLLSENAALRIEYRLQDFSGEKSVDYYYGTYTDKIDVTLHSMFFGVSLFI
jgi:opacity protein-like surface antigen